MRPAGRPRLLCCCRGDVLAFVARGLKHYRVGCHFLTSIVIGLQFAKHFLQLPFKLELILEVTKKSTVCRALKC